MSAETKDEFPSAAETPAGAASPPATESASPEAAAELLARKEKEIERLRGEILYDRAELENFKKRTERRFQDALLFAAEPLVRDILPVLDNLERALSHAGEPGNGCAAVIDGVGHVLTQLRETLARHGVVPVEAEGARFDPHVHEALAQVPGEEDNKVASVHERGYLLHGRLLRPAKVVVSRVAAPPKNG
jgi:molecular chaperone GrpE